MKALRGYKGESKKMRNIIMRSIINFFKGLFEVVVTLAVGIIYTTIMIAAVIAVAMLFYALVTSVM